MAPKKKKKNRTPSGGTKDDGGGVSGTDKGKKGIVSKKATQRKKPPELLIAAPSAAAASTVETGDGHPSLAASGDTANVIVPGVLPYVANIVEDPVTPPEAAADSAFIITRGGKQHELRDVLQFQ